MLKVAECRSWINVLNWMTSGKLGALSLVKSTCKCVLGDF